MRDLNTVGLKGAADSKRNKMMGSPRPGYGRVNRVYEPKDRTATVAWSPPPEGESIINLSISNRVKIRV